MGLLDTLDTLDLSDEVKAQIRADHEAEVAGSSEENARLRALARKQAVEQEVAELSDAGFKENPGLLKFVRRVLLSDDSEPGLVLLSDADMELTGDDATGAAQKEEITVAGAVREFIKLLPKDEEGKIALSDQALASNAGDPPDNGDDDPAKKTEGAKERLGKITGNTVVRTRKRYSGGRLHVAAGGDA